MTYTNRNGDGDELYFVHKGTGTFYTEYGPIPYEPGDWILLPKGVSYRVRPDTAENYFLIIESVEEIGFADNGPIGRRAPVDPTVLFVPSPALDELGDGRNEEGEYPVRVKHQNRYSTLFYDFDPIDAEGWKGDYFPFKVNLRDVRNIMSNDIHIMPSAYATFATSAVLIGAVMPRPFEQRPGVERVPPFHRNLDYDEFMFIHDGTALGVPVPKASIAHYPRGAHHGLPAAAAAKAREFGPGSMADNEFVIVDTARALFPTDDLLASRRKHTALREAAAES
jgi:homogentisate 1,2-dioxygenase